MPTISEISSDYIDAIAAHDPVRGERWGVAADPTRLTDYSPAGYDRTREILDHTRKALEATQPTNEAERLGGRWLHDFTTGEIGVIDVGERERTLSIIVGPAASTRSVFDLMDKTTPEAWGHIAARLRAIPDCMAGYRASLQEGIDHHNTAARRQARALAEQVGTWGGDGDGGWFATMVREAAASGVSISLQAELDAAAKVAGNAYAALGTWLTDEYLQHAVESDAAGEERYQAWARFLLGTDLDLDEAYAWGWAELGRLEGEKAKEVERIQPGASFETVRDLLINDPTRSIHGVEAYREWLQYVTDEAISGLSGTEFDIPESIRRCEVHIPPEGSAAAAYYNPPSEDLKRPGTTWFPTVGRTSFPTWDDVSTVYHEAVPGHHLQGATIRLVELTRAHKLGFVSAHGEGWALYAERLMDELGWFRTPETRLGFLCAHAFRAARVVVDIGLHTGRPIPADGPRIYPTWSGKAGAPWTYEGAIEFMTLAGGMAHDKAESEILRYLSWPSQATAYKLGERTWLAGRDAAMAAAREAGRPFDRKGWHARALALGPLGLKQLGSELARI